MKSDAAFPSTLVGDWRHVRPAHNDTEGYFTILSDGRYIGYISTGMDQGLLKQYPSGWITVRYWLALDSEAVISFRRPLKNTGIPHTYTFDGDTLILKRIEPPERWFCTRVCFDDLSDSLSAEKARLMNKEWKK